MRYIGFLRWWLFATLIGVGCYFAYDLGVFRDIWVKDSSKLSFLIMAIFIVHTIWCGIKTFKLSKHIKHGVITTEIKNINRYQEIGWFSSEACLNIGMIGTVVGFIMMLVGFTTVDTSQVEKIQGLLASMSAGMSTALYTTLVGLVCSQMLKVQYFNLAHCLDKVMNEFPDPDDEEKVQEITLEAAKEESEDVQQEPVVLAQEN